MKIAIRRSKTFFDEVVVTVPDGASTTRIHEAIAAAEFEPHDSLPWSKSRQIEEKYIAFGEDGKELAREENVFYDPA